MRKRYLIWILVFGIILLGSPPLFIFGIFALLYLGKERISPFLNKLNLSLKAKFLLLGISFGLFTEILAIIDNLEKPPEERILFHPDPAIDFLMGIGFYSFIAILWWLCLKRFQFRVREVFLVGGAWGITVEQTGAILTSIFTQGISGLIAWFYVLCVYGSFMAIPYLLLEHDFSVFQRKNRVLKYLVAFLGLYLAFGLSILWMIAITLLVRG